MCGDECRSRPRRCCVCCCCQLSAVHVVVSTAAYSVNHVQDLDHHTHSYTLLWGGFLPVCLCCGIRGDESVLSSHWSWHQSYIWQWFSFFHLIHSDELHDCVVLLYSTENSLQPARQQYSQDVVRQDYSEVIVLPHEHLNDNLCIFNDLWLHDGGRTLLVYTVYKMNKHDFKCVMWMKW